MLITQHIIGLELLMENAKLKMQELQDARTTNFNAYASVRGNYAQHFGRNTALMVSSGQHEYINCVINSVGRDGF